MGKKTRQQYDIDDSEGFETPRAPFPRASSAVLASRRIFKRKDRYLEYFQTMQALNTSFKQWVHEQISKKGNSDLSEGIADYIEHATKLNQRFLKKHGEVLTFGSGDCGQLAHGIDNDEDLQVKFPRIVYSLRDKQVCSIACGGLHNAVSTKDGRVWTWGCGDDGALGRTGEENLPGIVQGAISGHVITHVACGDSQTLALSVSGEVFGWGSYKDKEGKPWFDGENPNDIQKLQKEPYHIKGLAGICDIKCGASFNLALDNTGQAISWGLGELGELSREVCKMRFPNGSYNLEGIFNTHLQPCTMKKDGNTDIGGNEFVKSIGCGGYHSLVVLNHSAEVFTSGLNNYGQLGLGDDRNRQFLTKVSSLDGYEISLVTGGIHHSVVCSEATGFVYAFGRGDSGQLGVNESPKVAYAEHLPIQVSINDQVSSIACGANHNLALSRTGNVYTWGYGDMLALGHGEESDEFKPKKLNFKLAELSKIEILQIEGGGQHSAIIGTVTTNR